MPKLVTDTIELLRPYQAGKPLEELARELGIQDAVKLASNENPLGPSALAVSAMQRAIAGANRYPDAAAYRLRQKLAAIHGVKFEEILQGSGSNELIDLLVRTFTTSGKHLVFADPSFDVYRMAALAHGVPFSAVPLRDLTHDLDAMTAALRPDTALVFVANPNNPTGTYVGRAALQRFLAAVPPAVIVAIDEAYFEYGDEADYPDSLKLRDVRERLVVLRTFSKIYGLAAQRVGYAIGPAELIDYMNRLRPPFNVNSVGQEGAIAALDDTEHVRRSQQLNASQRDRVTRALRELGCKVAPSQANFVFLELARPAQEVYEKLLEKGVIVRAFGGLPQALRITIGTVEENTRLLSAMSEVLS